MDDEIVIGLAGALDAIEEHSGAARYSDPALAAWIQSMSAAMLNLQTFLTENVADVAPTAAPRVPREPSPAACSAGGNDPLEPGVVRLIPKRSNIT